MYLIRGLCPRRDISIGCHAFCIELADSWPALVAASELNQEKINGLIERNGADWLDSCGYSSIFDPDNCGFNADKKKPPGPNARRMHEPRSAIRVSWGEWGVEHISVPGNACGLDIDRSQFGLFLEGGRGLFPHNIDCWAQKNLLLIVFTEIAADIVLLGIK